MVQYYYQDLIFPPPINLPPICLPNNSTHVHAIYGSLLLIWNFTKHALKNKFTIHLGETAIY